MPRTRRITTSMALGAALVCAALLAPRLATAEPDHRGQERRHERRDARDDRRHERRDEGRHDRHDDDRNAWHGDRHDSYRHREPRWEPPHGRVVVRLGGPRVVYCPPPPPQPVRVYYDPYCRTSYASLALFSAHALQHGHISFVWVLEGGQPRYACRYDHDRWERANDWWPREGWARHCN